MSIEKILLDKQKEYESSKQQYQTHGIFVCGKNVFDITNRGIVEHCKAVVLLRKEIGIDDETYYDILGNVDEEVLLKDLYSEGRSIGKLWRIEDKLFELFINKPENFSVRFYSNTFTNRVTIVCNRFYDSISFIKNYFLDNYEYYKDLGKSYVVLENLRGKNIVSFGDLSDCDHFEFKTLNHLLCYEF